MKIQISLSTALGTSTEARLKRAQLMGFNLDKVWYHGSKNKFDFFDIEAESVERNGNMQGIYLTPYRDEAMDFGHVIYSVFTRVKHTFNERSLVSDKMMETYANLLKKHTSYNGDWVDDVIAPQFKRTGVFKDVSGNIKTAVLMSGGYDSWLDGRHLCVFDPVLIRSVDAIFDPKSKATNGLML